MATGIKIQPQSKNVKTAATVTPVAPRPSETRNPGKASKPAKEFDFLFDKENYMWMAAGVALILIGFMLMSGGKSPDPHKFLWDEIYSFRRITLAPIVILTGFGIEVYAIMKLPKDKSAQ